LGHLLTVIWDVLIGAGDVKPAKDRVGGDSGVAEAKERDSW
jgi:hypothetical protein